MRKFNWTPLLICWATSTIIAFFMGLIGLGGWEHGLLISTICFVIGGMALLAMRLQWKPPVKLSEDSEEFEAIKAMWFEEAKKVTPKTLPRFIDMLIHGYEHDYGTICHAMSAAALAGAYALEHSPQGGITGFQSGFVMWGFLRNWLSVDGPLSLIQWRNLLYPQHVKDFPITIMDQETMDYLQAEAKKLLADPENGDGFTHPEVKAHWERLAAGQPPEGLKVVA